MVRDKGMTTANSPICISEIQKGKLKSVQKQNVKNSQMQNQDLNAHDTRNGTTENKYETDHINSSAASAPLPPSQRERAPRSHSRGTRLQRLFRRLSPKRRSRSEPRAPGNAIVNVTLPSEINGSSVGPAATSPSTSNSPMVTMSTSANFTEVQRQNTTVSEIIETESEDCSSKAKRKRDKSPGFWSGFRRSFGGRKQDKSSSSTTPALGGSIGSLLGGRKATNDDFRTNAKAARINGNGTAHTAELEDCSPALSSPHSSTVPAAAVCTNTHSSSFAATSNQLNGASTSTSTALFTTTINSTEPGHKISTSTEEHNLTCHTAVDDPESHQTSQGGTHHQTSHRLLPSGPLPFPASSASEKASSFESQAHERDFSSSSNLGDDTKSGGDNLKSSSALRQNFLLNHKLQLPDKEVSLQQHLPDSSLITHNRSSCMRTERTIVFKNRNSPVDDITFGTPVSHDQPSSSSKSGATTNTPDKIELTFDLTRQYLHKGPLSSSGASPTTESSSSTPTRLPSDSGSGSTSSKAMPGCYTPSYVRVSCALSGYPRPYGKKNRPSDSSKESLGPPPANTTAVANAESKLPSHISAANFTIRNMPAIIEPLVGTATSRTSHLTKSSVEISGDKSLFTNSSGDHVPIIRSPGDSSKITLPLAPHNSTFSPHEKSRLTALANDIRLVREQIAENDTLNSKKFGLKSKKNRFTRSSDFLSRRKYESGSDSDTGSASSEPSRSYRKLSYLKPGEFSVDSNLNTVDLERQDSVPKFTEKDSMDLKVLSSDIKELMKSIENKDSLINGKKNRTDNLSKVDKENNVNNSANGHNLSDNVACISPSVEIIHSPEITPLVPNGISDDRDLVVDKLDDAVTDSQVVPDVNAKDSNDIESSSVQASSSTPAADTAASAASAAAADGREDIEDDKKDGNYFLDVVAKETELINRKCACVQKILDLDETSEEVRGKIRAAVGNASLLTSKKFEQFKKLCYRNLNESPGAQFSTTCEDLAGFWDLVLIQVDNINSALDEIQLSTSAVGETSSPAAATDLPPRAANRQFNKNKKSGTNPSVNRAKVAGKGRPSLATTAGAVAAVAAVAGRAHGRKYSVPILTSPVGQATGGHKVSVASTKPPEKEPRKNATQTAREHIAAKRREMAKSRAQALKNAHATGKSGSVDTLDTIQIFVAGSSGTGLSTSSSPGAGLSPSGSIDLMAAAAHDGQYTANDL